MTIPEEIVPDVTTGHVDDHVEIHAWLNNYTTIIVPPDAPGSEITNALADAHAAGGGNVKLMGRAYTLTGASGTVAMDIYLPTVNLDLNGATISYVGDGICLRVRMDPFTIANAGHVRDGKILGKLYDEDGTTVLDSAGAGAIGVQTGAVIGFGWSGVSVEDFDDVGSVNWDQYNEDSGTWMERCHFSRCDSRNGTVCWQWRAHASSPSFLYNAYEDCRYEADGSDQTVFRTLAPAQVFDASPFGFRGNVNNGATVFDLASISLIRPHMAFSIEQTNGLDAVLFKVGSDQVLYPRGSWVIVNFPDYDAARQFTDYQDRGEDVTFDPLIVNTLVNTYHGFGLVVGTTILGTYTVVYDGGQGANFAVLKVPFEGDMADARVVAELDSVTKAEIGFRPGAFTSGSRPAATAVPAGTGIYITDVNNGIPVWSDGTVWRDGNGDVA